MANEDAWMPRPSGVGSVVTAMVTPLRSDGDVDLDGVQVLARHLVDHGTDTVLVNGTTGESPTLQGDERWQVLAAVREAVGSDALIMMGTGSNATATTIASTVRATEAGADALMVVTPYYNRPDQRGVLAHFTQVAAATDLPIVMYDIPQRTGREIEAATLVELAAVPNLVGVKDATADLGKLGDVIAATRHVDGGFAVWCGADEVNLPVLAVGGVGVISVSAHLCGPEISAMIQAFPSDPATARELHLRCLPLHRALFAEPSPAPLKAVLGAIGLPAGGVRAPLVAASDPVVARAVDAYETLVAQR